jgi:protein tyrosine phosphatase (PTP) superfamily phosphohydrolase (DUF442 family)
MRVSQAYNFRVIDEATSTSGLLSEEQLSVLRKDGYEAVINLLPHDNRHAVKNEQSIVAGQGVDYFYIPVNFEVPTEHDYADFVRAMKSCREKKVLIHCAANYRVSAFYAIYAFEYLGWSAEQAREHIASLWCPAEHPPWGQFISRYIPVKDN